MTPRKLAIGLGPNDQMLVYLPGPNGEERTITLPHGKETELLFVMLHAQRQGEHLIESDAEPTQSLANHIARHAKQNAMGFFDDRCAHCRKEQQERAAIKVQRKETANRQRTIKDVQRLLAGLPEADRLAFIATLAGQDS